jgi:hypothetical protein
VESEAGKFPENSRGTHLFGRDLTAGTAGPQPKILVSMNEAEVLLAELAP